MRIPEASRLWSGALLDPGRIEVADIAADKDLVLDDDGKLELPPFSMKSGSPKFRIFASNVSRMSIARGDPRVGIEPRDAVGVVVVPDKPGALVVAVVVFGLVCGRPRVEDLVVQEAEAVGAVRGPPVERPAVADPGDETAVEMDRRAVHRLVRAGEGRVDRDDGLRRKIIPECDLDRRPPLRDDNPPEMRRE